MMGDFDDFAAEAQRKVKTSQAQAEEMQKAREEERAVYISQQIDMLQTVAVPIMEDAKTAFERNGLIIDIQKSWEDVYPFGNPEIKFLLSADKKRPHANGTYRIKGEMTVIVSADKTGMLVRISTNPYGTNFDKSFSGRSVEDLKVAIKRTAQTIYDALEKP